MAFIRKLVVYNSLLEMEGFILEKWIDFEKEIAVTV